MKSSELRKRYILLHSIKMTAVLPDLERELFRALHSKRKFIGGEYAIFLTNQFQKDRFVTFVRQKFPGVNTVVTSGTIKKCKSVMESLKKSSGSAVKEVSSLL